MPLRRDRPYGIALLLELVIGLGIFSVSMLAMLSIFPSSHRAMTEAKNYAMASSLARDYMDQERGRAYALPQARNFPVVGTAVVDGKSLNTTFTVDIAHQMYELGTPTERRGIEVRVSWAEGATRREVFYESFEIL